MNERRYNNLKNLILIILTFSGAFCTLIYQILDNSSFSYPIFETFLVFLAQAAWLPFLPIHKKYSIATPTPVNLSNSSIIVKKFGKYICCLSALCDFTSSFMTIMCTDHLLSFEISLLSVFSVFVVVFYQKFFKKKKFYKHQKIGLMILLLSILCLLGIMVLLYFVYSIDFDKFHAVYILVILLSQIPAGFDWIIMEEALKELNISPYEVTSIKGFTGVILCVIFYIPLCYIVDNQFQISDAFSWATRTQENLNALWLSLLILMLFVLNISVAFALKYSDSIAVCTANAGKMVITWIYYVSINYGDILFLAWAYLLSGIIIIIAIVIYNEIAILPCYKMKKEVMLSIRGNMEFQKAEYERRKWQYSLENLSHT